jgi:hypothetical protein
MRWTSNRIGLKGVATLYLRDNGLGVQRDQRVSEGWEGFDYYVPNFLFHLCS